MLAEAVVRLVISMELAVRLVILKEPVDPVGPAELVQSGQLVEPSVPWMDLGFPVGLTLV